MGWPGVRIPEVRPESDGTALAVVRVRDRGTGVLWTFGVRVGRGGEVLDDAILLDDRPGDGGGDNRSRERAERGRGA